MQGAVAGTPGTLPTNWSNSADGSGITSNVVAVGTENGISYIDIRYQGTATASAFFDVVRFDTGSSTAAVNGQVWTGSAYIKLQAGTTTGLASNGVRFGLSQFNSSSVFLSGINGTYVTPTTSVLGTQRLLHSFTTNNASVAFVNLILSLQVISGSPIDITLRIGMPQLEQGAFATSVIPTTTAAATRAADVAVMTGANFSNWYNATAGAIFVDYATLQQSGFPAITTASDGTNSNRIQLSHVSAARRAVVTAGGVGQWDAQGGNLGSTTSGVFAKYVLAYESSNYAAAVNGGTPATQLSGSVPSGLSRLSVGADGAGSAYLNGHLRRIAYFNRRLTNAELQAITA